MSLLEQIGTMPVAEYVELIRKTVAGGDENLRIIVDDKGVWSWAYVLDEERGILATRPDVEGVPGWFGDLSWDYTIPEEREDGAEGLTRLEISSISNSAWELPR